MFLGFADLIDLLGLARFQLALWLVPVTFSQMLSIITWIRCCHPLIPSYATWTWTLIRTNWTLNFNKRNLSTVVTLRTRGSTWNVCGNRRWVAGWACRWYRACGRSTRCSRCLRSATSSTASANWMRPRCSVDSAGQIGSEQQKKREFS